MLAELLSQLQERQGDLEAANPGLTAALELSWDSLDEAAQIAGMALSMFAPTPLPQAMLEQVLDGVLSESTNRENISTACSRLIQKHWLQLIDENTYRLHVPVQDYLQTKLSQFSGSDRLKQAFCKAMVGFAKQLSDPPPIEECAAFAPAIPHIAEAVTTWQAWLTDENIVFPYFCLGRFYAAQGTLDQATHWYEQGLSEARNRLGNEHLAIAASLTHLANLYYTQSLYQEAEPLYQEALELLKQFLDEAHPAVTTSLTNLANLYRALGRDRPDNVGSSKKLVVPSYSQNRFTQAEAGEWTDEQYEPHLNLAIAPSRTAPSRMPDVPVTGIIEISDHYPPRVRFAGTLWRFRIHSSSQPAPLIHQQTVTIIGRQGNCLLIQI